MAITEPRAGASVTADHPAHLEVLSDRIAFKAVGADTSGAWSLFEVEAPAGSAVPLHRHAWSEAYYVLDGELEVVFPGGAQRATRGSFVHVPGGRAHALRNASEAPARYLLWAAPAGVESFFEDVARAMRTPGFGFPMVLELAARHGIEALPPGD